MGDTWNKTWLMDTLQLRIQRNYFIREITWYMIVRSRFTYIYKPRFLWSILVSASSYYATDVVQQGNKPKILMHSEGITQYLLLTVDWFSSYCYWLINRTGRCTTKNDIWNARMWKLNIFLFIISYLRLVSTVNSATCEEILKQNCSERLSTCGILLSNIYLSCGDLLLNEETTCSQPCRENLKRIETYTFGKALINCECESVKCLALRGRFKQCWDGELIQNNKKKCEKNNKKCLRRHKVRNSCSKVDEKCTKNKKCKRKHNKYFSDCHQLIEGYSCTSQCLSSTKRYFDYKLGKYTMRERLTKCQCDGTLEDAITCHTIRRHREKLCKNLVTENWTLTVSSLICQYDRWDVTNVWSDH